MSKRRDTTYQVNNLSIRWSYVRQVWQVYSPRGKLLEQFRLLSGAKWWAKKTKDYLARSRR